MPSFLSKLALHLPFVSQWHINRVYRHLKSHVETTRSRIDVPAELVWKFDSEVESAEFASVYEKSNPLVSICIATFNRGELLVNRTLQSLLGQTYKNIEIIIVGDHCTDDTETRLSQCKDKRVRFINLPEQGVYPPTGKNRWMVAGTTPINKGLELAQGDFICHCDDDDEFLPEKVEKLVDLMQREKPHFIWHPIYQEQASGEWELNPCHILEEGSVCTSSMFYHKWFRQVPWDIEAWRFKEPGDYNRIRRLKYIGMNAVRYDKPLIKHYKERNQRTG